MKCPKCGIENPENLMICSQCGCDLSAAPAGGSEEGDATGGVIPYKNPNALMA